MCGIGLIAILIVPLLSMNISVIERSWAGADAAALPQGSIVSGSLPTLYAPIIALLGPFPWAFSRGTNSVYMSLYPGMVVWILALPAAFLGVWEALRRGTLHVRGVALVTSALLLIYLAYFGNEGFFRQRITIELMLLIMALFALERLPQRATLSTGAWILILGPMILVQTETVPLIGGALLQLVLFGVLALGGVVRRVAWRARI
jgi:hypothetical protein